MARQLVQHVVEEPDAGVHVVLAAAVQVEADADLRLLRLAFHVGLAHRHCPLSAGLLTRRSIL
jgi:hypothetical protein